MTTPPRTGRHTNVLVIDVARNVTPDHPYTIVLATTKPLPVAAVAALGSGAVYLSRQP